MLIYFNHIQAQETNISEGAIFEGEPFLAMRSDNPQQLCIAWIGYVAGDGLRLSIKTRSSFDGGKTWRSIVKIPHLMPTFKSADPSMVYDELGNLYLCMIDYRESPDSGFVLIYKSIDNGLNWNLQGTVISCDADPGKAALDRPWLSISNNGSQMTVTSKPAPWIAAPNRAYRMHSFDKGKTWTHWKYVDTSNALIGNLIKEPMTVHAYASNGTLFMAYPSYVTSQNIYPQFILAQSKDAQIFNYRPFLQGTFPKNDSAKLGYQLLTDPSNSNHLVFIFPGGTSSDIDIHLVESFDAGNQWTSPIRINDDPIQTPRMQDLVWGSLNELGDLIVCWRDRRKGASAAYAEPYQMMAAYRPHDSMKFDSNFNISLSSVPFANVLAQNGNDFMSVKLHKDSAYAVWAYTRDGSLDIWFTNIQVNNKQANIAIEINPKIKLELYPNPSQTECMVHFDSNEHLMGELYQSNGQVVQQWNNINTGEKISISELKEGEYFFIFHTKDGKSIIKKWIKN